MKIGLYSISCSGVWFNDRPALTVEEFVDTAKKYDYDGVEIDLKRPHGSPIDLDSKRCKEIKDYVAKSGLDMCAVAANNNFATIVPEQIENELLMVKEQIRVAKELGAPVLRLFACWPGIVMKNGIGTYETPRKSFSFFGGLDYEIRIAVVDALKECSVWAKEAGVMLALQNHAPVIETYRDMLDFVKWVDSPWLKCCFDAPCCGWNEHVQSDSYMAQAVKDVGDLQVLSHANAEFKENADGSIEMISFDPNKQPVLTNYPVFVEESLKVGYKGYLNYEFCHIPFQGGKVLGYSDYIEDQIRLAAIYFKGLVKKYS